jgi:RimJ/RimL family protein N-acetyltransferase
VGEENLRSRPRLFLHGLSANENVKDFDTPVLSDGMVTLDAFQLQDAESHLAGEDEELARRFGWFPNRSTLAGVRESIARWQQEWATGGPTRAFALRLAVGGELVGGCELRMRGDGTASMSYWTFAAYRRRGLATRAVRLASGCAFGTLGLSQIELDIEPDNTASRGVAQRAGFTETDTTQASPGQMRSRERCSAMCWRRDTDLLRERIGLAHVPGLPHHGRSGSRLSSG